MKLQQEMLKVAQILDEVGATASRNEKIEILSSNKDNEILQKVFLYAYSPYKIYGFGKKSLEGVGELGIDMIQSRFPDIFNLLDYLTTVNANNQIRGEVVSFLTTVSPVLRDLYIRMILKDLRIGVTATIANTVWKGLVPKFELMQGKKYQDYAKKIEGKTIVITTKLDGHRFVIIKENNHISTMSRQGKPIEGCVEIEEEAIRLPDNMVYDGEVLSVNPENLSSKELFNTTKKIVSSKGTKKGLEYHIFDAIPLAEFEAGKSKEKFLERKRFITNLLNGGNFKHLKNVPVLYVGKDLTKVDELLRQAIENEQEGLMVNLDAPYECKRSSNLLKVKQMNIIDLLIIGVEEGEGKYKNSLGRINVDYKGNSVGVGSGFTDEMRKEIWGNKDKYIGRVAEIQYFEESENSKDEELSLRFPIFLSIREVGKEVSYH